jgi:hypothetical protein
VGSHVKWVGIRRAAGARGCLAAPFPPAAPPSLSGRFRARELCEHPFVASQGSPFMRFRRALDRGNVTEALSAASELPHVGLAEALELCLLIRDKAPERYPRRRFAGTDACAGRSTRASRKRRRSWLRSLSWRVTGRETRPSLSRICSAGGDWNVPARHLSRGRERLRAPAAIQSRQSAIASRNFSRESSGTLSTPPALIAVSTRLNSSYDIDSSRLSSAQRHELSVAPACAVQLAMKLLSASLG